MICNKCQETIPDISRYCLHCGASLNISLGQTSEKQGDDEQIDWDNRILCRDGACIGTVAEGKCTLCGLSEREEPQ
jgi:predicted amidophosphoribosyltransferase